MQEPLARKVAKRTKDTIRRGIATRSWWPTDTAPRLAMLAAVVVLAGAAFVWQSSNRAGRVPPGLAKANGRIEVERVDIASKYPGRVSDIQVREGDSVEKNQILARLDTTELQAQLAAAKAAVRRTTQGIVGARAGVSLRQAELKLSQAELKRVRELEKRSVASSADLDRRIAQEAVAEAQIRAAEATVEDAQAAKQAAEAEVHRLEATLADMTLRAPTSGRVEYRLVQAGAVVGAGNRILTLLDLDQVYMTIFLKTRDAGRIALGSPARLVLDAAPDYVIPAKVTFISSEAQFTPKTVETSDERERLVYRLKLGFDPSLLEKYRDQVKAGLTGDAWVRVDPDVPWPPALQPRLPDAR